MKAILTFHSVDNTGSVLSYSPELFERLLTRLRTLDIPILDLGTLLEPETYNGVALTFDDGMRSVLENALPVLRDQGAPAHIFITTSAVNSGKRWPEESDDEARFDMLSWDDIEKLHDAGVMIDAHTKSHPDMRKLTPEQMIEECESANETIASRLDRRPEYFAYPFGYHNLSCRDTCRDLYNASVTTELRSLTDNEDLAALPRLDTYYFQSDWMLNNLGSPMSSVYLRLRWALRTLRGSHCVASYNSSA